MQFGPPATALSGTARNPTAGKRYFPAERTWFSVAAAYQVLPDDTYSRYLDAEIDGLIVGCIYLPNGYPAPGPKFDYKFRWFDRLATYSKSLLGVRAVLCGDYNVVPTGIDAVVPARWLRDAVFFPESGKAYADMLSLVWVGLMRRIHPAKGVYTYWNFSYQGVDRNSGLRMDHLLASPSLTETTGEAGVDEGSEQDLLSQTR